MAKRMPKQQYVEGSPTKVCSTCGVEKVVEEFTKQKRCVGGRGHTCKACSRAYNKERRREQNEDVEFIREREILKAERKAARLEENRKNGPRSKGGKYRYIEGSGVKTCSRCDETKPLSEFPNNKKCAGGVTGVCKKCNNIRQEAWRKKAYEEREDFRQRRYLSQEKAKAKRYGITLEQLTKMREESKGKCEICQTLPSEGEKPLHIDHCHTTGQVRGLLCARCNLCLGQIEEDVDLIVDMLIYIDKYKRKFKCTNTS